MIGSVNKVNKWIKNNKTECLLLLIIFSAAIFLRFYRLPEYMTFLGDEGRDALMIKRILTTYDFPLVGPPTSVGNMYLGPLYYYMMAIPMAMFWLNPVAAAYMVAVIGVLCVGLIYYLSREWFGREAAVVASSLYTFSSVNIIYSRSSWNPNPAPFFALLSIFGIYRSSKSGDYRWLIITGISTAAAIQMHYLSLILIPIVGLLWLYEMMIFKDTISRKRFFALGTILALMAFVILMTPLIIFDFKYNFVNFRALKELFLSGDSSVKFNLLDNLSKLIPIYIDKLVGRYIAGGGPLLSSLLATAILIPVTLTAWWRLRRRTVYWPLFALSVWLIGGLLGLSLYRQEIYDHYLGFLSPALFLLFGALIYEIGKIKLFVGRTLLFIGFIITTTILVIVNVQNSPLKTPPGNQLKRTQDIAKFVIANSEGRSFNFALLAARNYDSAYQFYLDILGHKPSQAPAEVTDQLFVVCEDPVCEPINSPKYEIAAFGWAKVESEKSFSGVKVFKLIHNPSGAP